MVQFIVVMMLMLIISMVMMMIKQMMKVMIKILMTWYDTKIMIINFKRFDWKCDKDKTREDM